MLLVVTDHARRRQFVLNALLRRSTDARLERLAHEQLVEKRKDRELLMAMTFHEVRNPLNGTMGHLQLARHVLQTTAVDGGSGSGGAGGEGDGGGGEGGLVAAALAEVDASLVCTEMALHFLGALSSLHRSVTAGMSAQPTLCDLSAVRAARRDAHAAPRHPGCNPTPSSLQPYTIQVLARVATIVRTQLQPGVALRLELPTSPLPVVFDATMLTQILTNLLQACNPA